MADKTGRDVLISWLNDAHGMETGLVEVLEHHIKDAQDFPQVQTRLQQHLEETRRHAEIVKGCVERLGGDVSSLKTGMASIFGKMQALSTGAAEDELIKNALNDYAAESFEVASYTSLAAGAMEIGEAEVATACRQILAEDQAMADWLQTNIPLLTQGMLRKMAGAGIS